MPSRDEHIRKAEHNKSFADSFNWDSTPFLDWVVTGFFYSALHYVDAYLATVNGGIHPHSHTGYGGRDSYVGKHLNQIYVDYRDLKQGSIDARYNMRNFTVDEVRNDILPLFDNIKNTISGLLTLMHTRKIP